MPEVIDNPTLLLAVLGALDPHEKELQLDIPSRTILRTAENQARDDWSYPNFRTSTCIDGCYFVSWGWKLPGTAWGFLSVPMTWVLKFDGATEKYFTRAEPDREGQYVLVLEHGQLSLAIRAGNTVKSRSRFFENFKDMLRVRV